MSNEKNTEKNSTQTGVPSFILAVDVDARIKGRPVAADEREQLILESFDDFKRELESWSAERVAAGLGGVTILDTMPDILVMVIQCSLETALILRRREGVLDVSPDGDVGAI